MNAIYDALVRANAALDAYRAALGFNLQASTGLLPDLRRLIGDYLCQGLLCHWLENELFAISWLDRHQFKIPKGLQLYFDSLIQASRHSCLHLAYLCVCDMCMLASYFKRNPYHCNRSTCFFTNVCICDDRI